MYKNFNGMVFLSLILIIPFNLFALSATTANTIQGSRPIIVVGSGSSGLASYSSFKFDNIIYNQINGTYSNTTLFDQLKTFGDSYGNSTLNLGNVESFWFSNNNQEINPTVYKNSTLKDLADTYDFPLTLKIVNSGVYVKSQYGDPKVSDPVDIINEYLINYERGIYALRPISLNSEFSCQWKEYINGDWNCTSTGSGIIDNISGGGYSSDYIRNVGFKPKSTGKVFPTTGFKGAKFQVVMIGNQSDYNFYSSDITNALIDNDGYVTFINKKPSSPVTITVKLKTD